MIKKLIEKEVSKQVEKLREDYEQHLVFWRKHSKAMDDHSMQIEKYLKSLEGILKKLSESKK